MESEQTSGSSLADTRPNTCGGMAWIREELERRDWTETELAGRLDVTPSTVQRWISGMHKPTPGVERRLRRLLKRQRPLDELAEVIKRKGLDPEALARKLAELPDVGVKKESSETPLTG